MSARSIYFINPPVQSSPPNSLTVRVLWESSHYYYLIEKERMHVPLVEFTYLVFTHMPGESYRRRLRSLLLHLCFVFRALINSLVCWFYLIENLAKVNVITVLDRSTRVIRSHPRVKLSTLCRYVSGQLDCCAHPSLKNKQKTKQHFIRIQFSSVQDGIYALGKAHLCSTPSLRSFPNVAFETVPLFVWLTMALSRPSRKIV